jgi:MoaA/NifB/PqqE/SkfB family radical SAM enzyme
MHALLLNLRDLYDVLADLPHLAKVGAKVKAGEPWSFSFDIADRCPIGCDCYWAAQDRVTELELPEVVRFFKQRRAEGMFHVTLVGGEPYVRPDVLAAVTPIMPSNWLVTSGTSPLRGFPNTTHFISVDGADAVTHDRVRRSKKLFERILRNLDRARSRWESFPVYIHTVLNAENSWQIQDILACWRSNGLADGVMFSTHTPIEGGGDERLRLGFDERVQIVGELLRCRRLYGSFLLNTDYMINALHPHRTAVQKPETCGMVKFVASYRANGERKERCIFGVNADCAQCGCTVTKMMQGLLVKHDVATMAMARRLRTRLDVAPDQMVR